MTTAAAPGEATPQRTLLNPDLKSPRAREFEEKLMARIVGQERAVRRIANLYQIYLAGLAHPGRPLGTMLFLGPTGSGKTRVVEAAAEALFGDPYAVVKIDCAEFQHSHEVAKLIGSPPGYLGHRETPPLLTQENLDKYHTEQDKLTFVLFDEIEKASDALWQLLLGILDKATLTLGDNRRVDFSKCMIVMTSNLGAKEMSELITGSIGFAPVRPETQRDDLDQKIYRTATEAARRKFSPEFMNRIDKVVVFRSLKDHHLERILELELRAVQERITQTAAEKFVIRCSPETKRFLLDEGIDLKYGARHLKRAIERFLVNPIASLVATQQVSTGDLLHVDYDPENKKLIFSKEPQGALVLTSGGETEHANPENRPPEGQAVALPAHMSPSSARKVSEN
ncbi:MULTISPECIES: AAA family ATPase [Chloracidobacterium]|jgi:ATP-dependent Clp protease ATP-binding subunit ClpB|uniref:C-terminal, D2-small domain, of ClpB protein, ATPase family associated with various cellular activities (AAA) n=2 Tax=Chloracidobacterium TaxID=458032 RepID=G2LIL2_CHLTF|nr:MULTISPECIES: AAA family ATPase [Chloracidobacterium]AEP11910.1 C-terminal, D2-small domain, of ClpB protein, ATPase family associated with various cellular activities (AAA) [Chloracidobacterium thermophilum B]QUV77670.1 ATP-dependent Clp protease ATP-binding subunit [Chloracidobacterium thermophilum]QUV80735.1 ATP-dependent Clp protease ATP-binding subunit [Chloracidobacterium sp. D]QUV84780.1 ATP-dependent Clp protease ATP-binding subunit [Chloracidobacterium sp. 2]QUV86733.1 ATP-dependen